MRYIISSINSGCILLCEVEMYLLVFQFWAIHWPAALSSNQEQLWRKCNSAVTKHCSNVTCLFYNDLTPLITLFTKLNPQVVRGLEQRIWASAVCLVDFCLLTWNSCEELDSITVTMERELSVSHGAVGNKCPSCDFVATVVTINTDCTSWLVTCCLGNLAGC